MTMLACLYTPFFSCNKPVLNSIAPHFHLAKLILIRRKRTFAFLLDSYSEIQYGTAGFWHQTTWFRKVNLIIYETVF